jgi:DDE superfamily endonuclease
LRSSNGADVRSAFPPTVVVAIKALACELPHQSGLPISRFQIPDLKRAAIDRGLVASIGETTLWRWLTEDALRPWCHRSWIFPRDPQFEQKAGRVLDLYARSWNGESLSNNDFVISADEKTSIQARRRLHPSVAAASGLSMRVEHEYQRLGAWVYLAAWDVGRAKVFGRCEKKNGIAPFDRLVTQVMSQEPYSSADRVFWIVDNGSSHRGEACAERLRKLWPNLILVNTPVHASWLNQIEIYFSIVQRKVLTPADFLSLPQLEDNLLRFQDYYAQSAKPFEWKFTRVDLEKLLSRITLAKAA